MMTIPLTQGQIALVSDEDYEYLIQWNWCADKRITKSYVLWYALRRPGRKSAAIYMHRVVANRSGINTDGHIDHIDSDGLNNQRFNLRSATNLQNHFNSRKRLFSVSKFKGVRKPKNRIRFQAHIKMNGKSIYLGSFVTEEEAATAYNRAAINLFGQYARLNSV